MHVYPPITKKRWWHYILRLNPHALKNRTRSGAMGGISGPCLPNHCLCPTSEKRAQKKVTGLVPLECISGPVPPSQNTSCASQAWVKSRSRTKTLMNSKTKPKISCRRPFFSFFWSSPLHLWARIEIRNIKFRLAPPGYEHAPLKSENCAPKGGKRPVSTELNLEWRPIFLVFTHEFEGKIYLCPPKIFFPPSHATLAPGLGGGSVPWRCKFRKCVYLPELKKLPLCSFKICARPVKKIKVSPGFKLACKFFSRCACRSHHQVGS